MVRGRGGGLDEIRAVSTGETVTERERFLCAPGFLVATPNTRGRTEILNGWHTCFPVAGGGWGVGGKQMRVRRKRAAMWLVEVNSFRAKGRRVGERNLFVCIIPT